jgi:hypothetical protein
MDKNIKFINYKKKNLAIIIKSQYKSNKTKFFTPNNYSQQLGVLNFKTNQEIIPHYHKKITRVINFTRETLIIKSGVVRVDFYEKSNKYIKSTILRKGDVILLVQGGHGFKILKKATIIEIKQGPYNSNTDKIRFLKSENKKITY